MKLPLASPLDSRDGTANKDARQTNVLLDNEDNVITAQVRPGLVTAATTTGNGNGAVSFNDVAFVIFGTSVDKYSGGTLTSLGAVVDGFYDFTQSTT